MNNGAISLTNFISILLDLSTVLVTRTAGVVLATVLQCCDKG